MRYGRLAVLLVATVLEAGLGPNPILAQDAERQVEQGQAIYARRCARCHGANGEGKMGPSLIGPQHHLSGYGTADVLFDYTSQVMPADRPGRMHEVEYWAVLAYLLKENGLLPPRTALGRANAPQIPLDHGGAPRKGISACVQRKNPLRWRRGTRGGALGGWRR